jgi:predicted Zn finger-like uncharacterized protein
MEVHCERCRARYEFGDDEVGWAGLTVRCSKCGHTFLVRKKGVIVAMPGELLDAPVLAADVDRAPAAPGTAPDAAAATRTSAWSLRSRRGGVYPFKDLATLQRWIVERKAARDDEVSHQGEPWRSLGDMPELVPFFSLVERAQRASAEAPSPPAPPERSSSGSGAAAKAPVEPTLIEFPVPQPHSPGPGPGKQPAPVKTEGAFQPPPVPAPPKAELRQRPRPIAHEGPAIPDRFGSVGAPEPAWTAERGRRPAAQQAKRASAPVRRQREAKGLRLAPIAVIGAVAAAALTVYLTKPASLGFKSASPPPAQSPVPPAPGGPGAPADVTEAPANSSKPAEHGQGSPAPTTSPLSPPRGEREAPPSAAAPTAPTPTPPSAPVPDANANANEGRPPTEPPSPTPSQAGEAREPLSTAAPIPPLPTPPSAPEPNANENSVEPLSPAPSPPRGARGTGPSTADPTIPAPTPSSTAAPSEPPSRPRDGEERQGLATEDTQEVAADEGAAKKAPPSQEDAPEPPKTTAAAPRRPILAAKPAESEKPRSLKRLLADAQRLRERGKPDAALGTYGRAIELEPENADALAGRGLCYLELSRYAPAEASFQAALEADAQHAGALMGLAETFRYEGRRSEAVTYYRKYLAAHPEGEDAVAARNAVDALKE